MFPVSSGSFVCQDNCIEWLPIQESEINCDNQAPQSSKDCESIIEELAGFRIDVLFQLLFEQNKSWHLFGSQEA